MSTDNTPGPTPVDERALYRERARLISFVAAHYPARLADNDPSEPDRVVLYVTTPQGQLSWHIDHADLDLFNHVPWVADNDPDVLAVWDGHTTSEKYTRLQALTKREAAFR